MKPFATQMASLISVIDVRRTWSVLPSPMEQLCSEITQIAPDSESRVAAIEKVGQNNKFYFYRTFTFGILYIELYSIVLLDNKFCSMV